jgi:hypothetical protein
MSYCHSREGGNPEKEKPDSLRNHQYSMTKTGRFERRVSCVWKFGFWSLEFV